MWTEITLETDPADAELVADLLRQHCSGGVAVEYRGSFPEGAGWAATPEGDIAASARRALVRAYLPSDEATPQHRRSLRLALRFAPLRRPPRWLRPRRLREEDWQRSWQRHLRARRIGRVLVNHSWDRREARAGDIVIEIDPGLAFGTGEHPTTAMCLRALQRAVRPGDRALDLGTGTGILAIAAAKLGAAPVLALDIDPQAVRAAGENARRNGVAERVCARLGTLTPEVAGEGPFQVIAVNIDGLTLERLAPLLARALAPGGRLVASGFLQESADALAQALSRHGLRTLERLEDPPWAALLAVKEDA